MATTRTNRKNHPQALDPSRPISSTNDKNVSPSLSTTRKASQARISSMKPAASTKATVESGKSNLPVPPPVRMAGKETRGRLNPAAQVLASRAKKGNSKSKSYVTPVPRTGRQFTVGSIGTNGLIYLRPVTRPGSELRNSRPSTTLLSRPQSRPQRIGTLSQKSSQSFKRARSSSFTGHESVISSTFSIIRAPELPSARIPLKARDSAAKQPGHVRSYSFSTVDDQVVRESFGRPENFHISIDQDSKRARVSRQDDDQQQETISFATANIPTAGAQLSKRPNRIDRAAATSNEESTDPNSSTQHRASSASNYGTGSRIPSSYLSRAGEVPRPLFQQQDQSDILVPRPPTFRHSNPRTSTSQLALQIYDNILKNPTNPSLVRFNQSSGDIVAATPSMLIAHITSPTFLDYELLSDFFLTYRGFMLASDLVTFLLARLRWAVDRLDDFGRIVRVRTFVALRHWILNYFADDFVPDIALRLQLCDLVNGLYHDLQRRNDGGAGDLKIIGELKKCWRRTCGLYWAGARDVRTSDDDIFPGRRPESISLMSEIDMPQQAGKEQDQQYATQTIAEKRGQSKQGGAKQVVQPSLISAANTAISPGKDELSPRSMQSLHVISCSIPFKPIYKGEASAEVSLVPHPIPVVAPLTAPNSSPYPGSKQKRPPSFIDAVRDDRRSSFIAAEKPQVAEIDDELIPAGALIHGSLIQPGSPYFDIKEIKQKRSKVSLKSPRIDGDERSTSPLRSPTQSESSKKLLGSIRRAFGGTNNAVENFLISQAKSKSDLDLQSSAPAKVEIRIDLLCSYIGERFGVAIEQAQQEEAAAIGEGMAPISIPSFAQHLSTLSLRPESRYQLNRSVTVGSRSIVIVDDTNSDEPVMSGALRPPSSIEKALQSSPVVEYSDWREKRDRQAATVSGPSPHRAKERKVGKLVRTTVASPPSASTSKRSVPKDVYIPTGYHKDRENSKSPSKPGSPTRHAISNSMTSTSGLSRRLPSYRSAASPEKGTLPKRNVSKSSDTNPVTSFYHTPAQKLRRKPGGNLRDVSKVNDFEHKIIRRHSFGSVSTMSRAQHASLFYDEVQGDPVSPLQTEDGKSLKNSGTQRRRGKSISLIQTHSSQPNLRPSFEAEVAKLKALPDDDDDDGGVESTLLKLEGRYEKRSPSVAPLDSPSVDRLSALEDLASRDDDELDEDDVHRKHHEHVEDVHPEHTFEEVDDTGLTAQLASVDDMEDGEGEVKKTRDVKSMEPQTRSIHQFSTSTTKSLKQTPPRGKGHKPNKSVAESTASYSSIPLLQRRQRDTIPKDRHHNEEVPSVEALLRHAESINSSVDHMSEPKTPQQSQPEYGRKKRMEPITSFLLDDTQSLSDEDILTGPAKTEEDEVYEDPEPPPVTRRSRKIVVPQALDLGQLSPRIDTAASSTRQPTSYKQGLPTPAVSPTMSGPTFSKLDPLVDRHLTTTPPQHILNEKGQLTPRQSLLPPHLPFILAYDADVVAQQFTLVEKDALDDLDWRELIDLRWNQAPLPVTDWVSYLRSANAWGVGLVIARFNLMVKWVLSEILLTEAPIERARTIEQYIKIAASARRMRNYATMYQITVALLSVDCVGLKRTWSLVPESAVTILRDLELVVQPLRNFHNLRVEMETSPPDAGCIPFIGIYTRDLVYNAQKSAIITSMPQNEFEPLVNFERHHTAATVVKTLLRLLEQSGNYRIVRNADVLSKCLWMATLEDGEIRGRCEKLD